MKSSVIWAVLLCAATACSSRECVAQTALSVGAATQPIVSSPDQYYPGRVLGGNIGPFKATGMDTGSYPLTASALALSNGSATVVLITLDILMMKAVSESWEAAGPGLDAIRQQINSLTGVPSQN